MTSIRQQVDVLKNIEHSIIIIIIIIIIFCNNKLTSATSTQYSKHVGEAYVSICCDMTTSKQIRKLKQVYKGITGRDYVLPWPQPHLSTVLSYRT